MSVFGLAEEEEEEEEEAEEEAAGGDEAEAAAAAKAAVSLPYPTTAAVPLPSLRREARSTSLASMDSDVGGANGGGGFGINNTNNGSAAALAAASVAATAADGGGSLGRGPPRTWDRSTLPARPQGLSVALKVAGVHWWYRHPSHAAELTGKEFFFFF